MPGLAVARPTRATEVIRRVVVAQLHTDEKEDDPVITKVVIAGRPRKTYGSSMGDHTTAFTIHVNAVQLALERYPLREAPQRMQDLVAGITEVPGSAYVAALPMPQRAMWVEAYDRFITLHKALETPPADLDLGGAIQEYVGAYLELRELVPLSTVNTALISTATAGKGKGEDVSALRAAAAGESPSAEALAAQLVGSLDTRAIAMACIETRPDVLAKLAPGLPAESTMQQRAELFVIQHLRSIRTAFPGAIAALATARGVRTTDVASSSSSADDRALARQRDDQVLVMVAQDLLARVVYPRIARHLAAELPRLKQEYFDTHERSAAAAPAGKRKAADSVDATEDPLQSAAKAAARRFRLACKVLGLAPAEPPIPRADSAVLSGRRMVKPPPRFDPAAEEARHAESRRMRTVDAMMKRQLAPQPESAAPREKLQRKDPLAIQVVVGEQGKVAEVRAAGRPPSPFSGTQGAHTTAWTVHVDRVRRLVVGLSLADALATVLRDLPEDRRKMVERLDDAFAFPPRPDPKPVEKPVPQEAEEEEEEAAAPMHEDALVTASRGSTAAPEPPPATSAFGTTNLPDAVPLSDSTIGTTDLPDAVPLSDSTIGTTDLPDAVPLSDSTIGTTDLPDAVSPHPTPVHAPRASRSLLLTLQAAIHAHLDAVNAIPGATLPAAYTGGADEGRWRRIIREHLGMPPYQNRPRAHKVAEVYQAVVGLVDLSVLRADPDAGERGLDELTIRHSRDPAARLVFQHLHAMEDSYPGVLAAAELTLPDDAHDEVVERVLLDALKDADERRKVKTTRVKVDAESTDDPTVKPLDAAVFGAASPHPSLREDDPFPASLLGNARWAPSLILGRDELATQPTARLLDDMGNLRDDQLPAFAEAFRNDIAVPGTYLAEGEGTYVAQCVGVHVDVYRDTPPAGFDVIDNVGRGDCLIYALEDIRRAVDLENSGVPRSDILQRIGSAESRRLDVGRIKAIRAWVRDAVPQDVIETAVRSVVLDEVTGRGAEGLGPGMRKLLHDSVAARGEIQAAASRRFRNLSEQAAAAAEMGRGQARKGLPAPAQVAAATPAPASAAAPVQAQLQFGSGPKLVNYALLHKGGNHYVALMRRG
jgi:hypothetical protein